MGRNSWRPIKAEERRRLKGSPQAADYRRIEMLSAHYQRIYDELNADCFDGALPRSTVVAKSWIDFVQAAERYGSPPLIARSDHWLKRIEVSDLLAGEWHGRVERILLHEFCHFQVLGHDEDFQAELRRVATLARYSWVARWVEEEVTSCARQERKERKAMGRTS